MSEAKILTTSFEPIKLLKIVNADDYEEIIREWTSDYLSKEYVRVERLGGANDKGRDIVCSINTTEWDNYQCKHYDNPLSPSMIWIEIGKFIYYVFSGEFTTPRKYYFMCPCGVSVTLRDLLQKPKELKKEFVSNWDKHCSKKITKNKTILLDGKFLEFVNNFNFEIFTYKSPQEFIDEFKKTPYFTKRFGTLQKPRPLKNDYPENIQEKESIYIRKILDAYGEHLLKNRFDADELKKYPELKKHFDRQRRNFYCAEYLNAYSREIHDPELKYFENLKNEIYDGIIDEIEDDAKNGFERLKKVLARAEQITITSNPLKDYLEIKDKKGICHHLANERDDVTWKK